MGTNENTFVKITNQDIYKSIQKLHEKHDELCKKVDYNSKIINMVVLTIKTIFISSFLWIGAKSKDIILKFI